MSFCAVRFDRLVGLIGGPFEVGFHAMPRGAVGGYGGNGRVQAEPGFFREIQKTTELGDRRARFAGTQWARLNGGVDTVPEGLGQRCQKSR